MTSINFNASATTALRTLQQTNSALETSQNRVSTGLKIGEAKDNAAYWSISTTLKSDNKTMGTVKDALSLGAGTIDTAYQGLNKSIEVMNEIKSKLTAATQSGIDIKAVQAEIESLQDQLRSIANSSSFSGENWLSRSVGDNTDKSVVASFTRDASGAVKIGTIEISTLTTALTVKNGTVDSTTAGILTKTRTSDAGYSATGGTAAAANGVLTTAVTLTAVNFLKVDVTTDAVYSVTIDNTTATNAGVSGAITTTAQLERVLNRGLADAHVSGVVAKVSDTGVVSYTSSNDFSVAVAATQGTATAASVGLQATATGASVDAESSVLGIDITSAGFDTITAYVDMVSAATAEITSAAASLGAVSSRIDLQTTFVSNLIDTIDKGVSDLIDADLSEESTRLQALQTKQQLGIQALSIANTSTQNILSLFRS